MYRGRTTISEAMALPNSVYLSLLHIKRKELEKDSSSEDAQLMEEELQGG